MLIDALVVVVCLIAVVVLTVVVVHAMFNQRQVYEAARRRSARDLNRHLAREEEVGSRW